MSFQSSGRKVLRHLIFYAATIGTAFGIATECDPTVRSTIFGGFQDLATSFLDAAFIKLQQTDTSIVTVEAVPGAIAAWAA